MWPDCSPPSDRPRFSISSITYLSPTGAAHQLDAELAQRELEADVAHHGRDDGVALQPALALQLTAAHQQHRVAVDDAPAVIDEDRAVAVAVERHAQLAAALDDRLARAAPGCVDPQSRLMLRPSGAIADDDRLEARGCRTARGAAVVVAPLAQSMAMREPVDRRRPPATRPAGGRGTRRPDRRAAPAPASPPRACHDAIGDDRLDLALDRLGELLAAAREHLDAVVLERIVRGGDHDARVEAAGARQDRRRPASARRRRSSPRRLRRTRRAPAPLDPVARLARVAADEQTAATRRRAAARARAPRRAGGRSAGSSGGTPAMPAHAVGSEQTRVRLSFATGNPHLHRRRRRCASRPRRGDDVGAHRQRILPGAEPGQIDERRRGRRRSTRSSASRLPRSVTIDGGRHGLRLQARPRGCAGAPAGSRSVRSSGAGSDLDGDRRRSRGLQPQRRIEQPDGHASA